jgi:hypothetical protein
MISELLNGWKKPRLIALHRIKKKQVLDIFSRPGLFDKMGTDHFYHTEEQALNCAW